jgi:hypothetical protein
MSTPFKCQAWGCERACKEHFCTEHDRISAPRSVSPLECQTGLVRDFALNSAREPSDHQRLRDGFHALGWDRD